MVDNFHLRGVQILGGAVGQGTEWCRERDCVRDLGRHGEATKPSHKASRQQMGGATLHMST